MRGVVEIISSLRAILQPIRILSCMIPNDICQREQSKFLFHAGCHPVNLLMLFFDTRALIEKIRSKCELVVDTVRRITVAAMIQGSKMNHIVTFAGKEFEETGPFRERPHPFCSDGLDSQSRERQVFAIEMQRWFDGKVVFLRCL